jgi:hypothetical protein
MTVRTITVLTPVDPASDIDVVGEFIQTTLDVYGQTNNDIWFQENGPSLKVFISSDLHVNYGEIHAVWDDEKFNSWKSDSIIQFLRNSVVYDSYVAARNKGINVIRYLPWDDKERDPESKKLEEYVPPDFELLEIGLV